ncbi:MAG TPA: PhoH family protein [Bacteroidales bacterium]|nr:PhoH family protein [Bacteroidales bacterium]
MIEKTMVLEVADLSQLYGLKDENLYTLQRWFAKLKLVFRGDLVKVSGDEEEVKRFEEKIQQVFLHMHKYNRLSTDDLSAILNGTASQLTEEREKGILLYSTTGKPVKARTKNQKALVDAAESNDMMFAIGPAGTGKTYTAIALAVKALKEHQVKRIILSRPAVEAGETLGFLPGDLREKLDPYLQPLYDALMDMIPSRKLEQMIEDKVIQIAPLGFMRGRTLSNAFVILDEAQNATYSQMKMFLTRMGEFSKFIITGDATQIDLPDKRQSGLLKAAEILRDIEGISFIYFDADDVIRHKLVTSIIRAYENEN